MKQITAHQAEDGMIFTTKEECLMHEDREAFIKWESDHSLCLTWCNTPMLHKWLLNNAEDIRGFLPPVAAKPELDIDVLKKYIHPISPSNLVVCVRNIERWLAGELE